MRERKLWWAVGGLTLALLLADGAFMAWPRPDRITRENFDRVTTGMSRSEVEAILGPPGDYRSGPTVPALSTLQKPAYLRIVLWGEDDGWSFFRDGSEQRMWSLDTEDWHVFFSPSGVTGVIATPTQREPQNTLENLLWRAKRQWRKWFPEK